MSHFLKITNLWKTQKLQEAKKYIEIALSIQPNNHYILDSMGWVYFRLGDLDIAYQFVKKAYDIQADPEIAAHLGEILWKQGKRNEAKQIWNNSLKSNPSNTVLVETSQRLQWNNEINYNFHSDSSPDKLRNL